MACVLSIACCFAFFLANAGDSTNQPAAALGSTNTVSNTPVHHDALKELEEELFRPFKQFTLGNKINKPIGRPLPQVPLPPSKRERELEERKKNWVFSTEPESLSNGLTEKEIFKLKSLSPEDQEKEKLSPMERYFQNLHPHNSSSTVNNKNDEGNSLSPVRPAGSRDTGEDEDERLPGFVRETARTLRKLSNQESDAESRSKEGMPKSDGSSIFSDIFGLGSKMPTHNEAEAQKLRMDEYRQIVGGSASSSSSQNSLSPVGSLLSTKPQAVAPYFGIVNTSSSSPQQANPARVGTTAGFRTPGSLPEVAVKSLPVPGLTPEIPKYEQPKVTPPTPTFSAPRRVFP